MEEVGPRSRIIHGRQIMTYHDQTYLELISYVLEEGVRKENRTGVPTFGVFGCTMRFNLKDGSIPLLTTKKMHVRSIIHELLWYLNAGDNVQYLHDNGVTIWDEWAAKDGSLGPVYGYQWRKWKKYIEIPEHVMGYEYVPREFKVDEIDQIAGLIRTLKGNPDDRRMIVTAWNVADLGYMALPPCHYSFQCYTKPRPSVDCIWDLSTKSGLTSFETSKVEELFKEHNVPTRELSMIVNQRSCDVGLGVPFNIVQYSLLLRMLCEVVNMTPGELIWNGGDVHIYENHLAQLKEQIVRQPFESPTFKFARKVDSIDGFKYEDFVIEGYQSHAAIKMDVAK